MTDAGSPPHEDVLLLDGDRFYRWCVYLYLPLEYVGLIVVAWQWTQASATVSDRLGLIFTAGITTGIGINAAHELGHKRPRFEVMLARVGLAPACYGHFLVEHNRGHHTRVATADDPASSRLGETFWRFWPRSVVGGFRSAWKLETERLRLRGRSVIGGGNEVLRGAAVSVLLAFVLGACFGPGALLFFFAQAAVGFTLLEVVNYLEHYGLARQRRPDGRYEPVNEQHSWNSDAMLSSVALYQLQRHSDHHKNPRRSFQTLRSSASSPELPFGYATMIPIALCSRLWQRIMNVRVLDHYAGDLALANVHPPARKRLRLEMDTRSVARESIEVRKRPVRSWVPSHPLRGGIATAFNFLFFTWLLYYAWGPHTDLGLGIWRTIIPVALFLTSPIVLRGWRGYLPSPGVSDE